MEGEGKEEREEVGRNELMSSEIKGVTGRRTYTCSFRYNNTLSLESEIVA